jgi:predicted TIM-barrel fold metal-dependent hydrolase
MLDEVWGLLAEAGLPVVVHCGSGPTAGRFTGPGPFGEVLARHPTLVAVIAHMGMPDYADFLELAARYESVYLDTTIAFTDFAERDAPFPREMRPRLADLAHRIVLGSDFPNVPHTYAHQLAALARLDLGEDWLRTVLWDNPLRLMGPPDPA